MKKIASFDGVYAVEPGFVTVYSFDRYTGEFCGETSEYVAVGVGIPGYSTLCMPPPSKDGKCRVFVNNEWRYVDDFRGSIIYGNNGLVEKVIKPGDLPDGYFLKPTKEHYVSAAEIKRKDLLLNSFEFISNRGWAAKLSLGSISEGEKELYKLWLKYQDDLRNMDLTSAPDINWPKVPENVA